MEEFIRHFIRDGAGAWSCVSPATLELPSGRIQVAAGTRLTRGSVFMGIDVARLLDEHYERTRRQL